MRIDRYTRAVNKYWLALANTYRRCLVYVETHPIILIFLAPAYLTITVGVSFVLAILYFAIFGYGPQFDFNVEVAFGMSFILIGMIFSAHYLYLTIRSFFVVYSIGRSSSELLRVLQLVATTAIFFAVIHYCILILSKVNAYHGIEKPHLHNPIFGLRFIAELTSFPPLETVLDCLYFSTVTMATVGYGDIYPLTMAAKIATMAQIFFSFGLIVVVLGWVISHTKDNNKRFRTKIIKYYHPRRRRLRQ